MSVSGAGTADRHNNWDGGASTYLMARRGNVNIYGMLEYTNGVTEYVQKDSTLYDSMTSLVENRESYSRSNTFSGMANIEWMFKPEHSLNFNLYAYKDIGRSDVSDNYLYSFSSDATISSNKGRTHDDLLSGTLEYNAKFKDNLNLKVSYGLIYGGTDSDNSYSFTAPAERSMSAFVNTKGTQHILRSDITKKFDRTTVAAGLRTDIGSLKNNVAYSGDISS